MMPDQQVIDALRSQLSAVSAAIGSVRFMDPPDGGDVSLAEQVTRMRQALERAEAALVDMQIIIRHGDGDTSDRLYACEEVIHIAQGIRALPSLPEAQAVPVGKALEGVDYSRALIRLKAGASMRRKEWRPNKWVVVARPSDSLSYLEMVLSDGRRAPYTPSRCDQFTDDWIDAADIIRRD
jgi:hypothetical protein